ncbi:DUF1146 family protein [Bombilactobacillus thymidiniphilus]|uniref:DUF1146 family protein n=1 Tax=Bombilactobacillus thymidiniphilus TaxID=2923363 RepID=A0ABY4PDI0_9LACO|nr:DUF1146 family protein [Bombilactobacillus thymidiniphilus]UQS83839.1 DUF1146 family protein [Bombilactobacillus thymidiniphilus]
MKQLGFQSILIICSHLFFIWMAFLAVQTLDWNKFFHNRANNWSKVLIVLLAVTIGYTVSSCFINILQSFQNLIFMF